MGRLVRACIWKHLYISVVQAAIFFGITIAIYSNSHNHPSKVSYQLHLCNCQLTLCVHPSKHASLSLCVRVCVCEMCLHASVHNIMCSAQPEVAAVLYWYGPEADPAYWQRGREEVAGLQVVCEAHNLHVGGKFLGHPPEF